MRSDIYVFSYRSIYLSIYASIYLYVPIYLSPYRYNLVGARTRDAHQRAEERAPDWGRRWGEAGLVVERRLLRGRWFRVDIPTCMFVFMHVCTYVCTYVCMYVCIYIYIYIYVCVCLYICGLRLVVHEGRRGGGEAGLVVERRL